MKSLTDGVDPITQELTRTLSNQTIYDERKVLQVIADAITNKFVDSGVVDQAVRQTLNLNEVKLRVFAIAAANRQLNRTIKLLTIIDDLEAELGSPERFASMSNSELLKLYALAQMNLIESLDYIKSIATMRQDVGIAQASMISDADMLNQIQTDLLPPTLDAQQRGRVRLLLENISKEVIVTENNEEFVEEQPSQYMSLMSERRRGEGE